ncbi:MAG: hypothetical protein HY909_28030 [Deltaproteobacteria bacterium]|nr:hypothetical protein [Deltaproteobacteria bacterium]
MRACCLASLCLVACAPDPAAPPAPPRGLPDHVVPGRARPVDPGEAPPAPRPALPLDEARGADDHLGRAPRRLDVDQLRAAFDAVLGAAWIAPRPPNPTATPDDDLAPTVDLFEFFAQTLGKPDYLRTTERSVEPSLTFAKLVNDAARALCREAVARDPARPPAARRIYLRAAPADTLAAAPDAVRANLAELVRRFWALDVRPDAPTVDGLATLFRAATALPSATPADGWRAVCIDLATDPRFLVY